MKTPKAKPSEPQPSPSHPSSPSSIITDALFADLERLGNTTIHELVLALHHLEDDNADSALDCLCQVGLNLEQMQHQILAAQQAPRPSPPSSPSLTDKFAYHRSNAGRPNPQ